MLTLLIVMGLFFIFALLVAFFMGMIALSPIVLIVLGFVLIDVLFIKLIFRKKK